MRRSGAIELLHERLPVNRKATRNASNAVDKVEGNDKCIS